MTVKTLLRRLGWIGAARFVLLQMLHVRCFLIRIGVLSPTSIPYSALVLMGNAALARGKHKQAIETYISALARWPEDLLLRLQIGVTAFLAGDYVEAEKWFASSNQTKHFDLSRWGLIETKYRILDRTWMLAIGHVASIDTYIKAAALGWMPQKMALLAYNPSSPPSGWPLFRYFSEHIRIIAADRSPEDAIDEVVHGPSYRSLNQGNRDNLRASLSQPFWYGQDEQGHTRWFAPLGAAVEAAWKAAGRGPLLNPSTEDRQQFRKSMQEIYGLPIDAWFVVLHVREPGYHAAWHKHHPGTRNAEVSTYQTVIDFILSKGGWVVRGGDPTMTKIPVRDRVIDYATSARRSPEIDILLCAECTYFVGTNSGFSVVPPVFGKRCALTNWSPIGIPNWYLDDIYIPKLVRRTQDNRVLTFTEMYKSVAGWSQFERDFKKTNFTIEDNNPEDLLATVQELHAEIFDGLIAVRPEDTARLKRFNAIAVSNGGYVGSRMSYRFLEKYEHLLA